MDVEVESVVCLHLQGGLHTRFGEGRPRPAAAFVAGFPEGGDFRQPRLGVVVFLRVVVARNPPSLVVARHGKLGQFLLEPEAGQGVRDGKLVAESKAVVVEAEADLHDGGTGFGGVVHACDGANRLFQGHQKLVVVVPDFGLFAPNGFPSLVESGILCFFQDEMVFQVVAPFENEAHFGGQNHGFSSAVEGVIRHAIAQFKAQFKLFVRALQFDRFVGESRCQKACCQTDKYE